MKKAPSANSEQLIQAYRLRSVNNVTTFNVGSEDKNFSLDRTQATSVTLDRFAPKKMKYCRECGYFHIFRKCTLGYNSYASMRVCPQAVSKKDQRSF